MSAFGMTSMASPAPAAQDKFQEFVKQVAGEMVAWENSGLWQLSALSPMKDFPLIPGFEDTSPEETRVEAYIARNDPKTMQEYEKKFADKFAKHRQLRMALHSNTPEALQVLRDVYAAGTSGNPVQSTVFAKPASNWNTFGSTGAPFGGAGTSTTQSSGSLFGGTTASANSTTSLFSKPAQSSAFGSAPAFGSLGSPTAVGSSSNSIFGGGATQANKPLFGSSGTSAFSMTSSGNNPGSSLFGANKTQVTQSNAFGGTSTSIFGANNTNNAAPSSSIFGASPSNQTAAVGSGGVFGGSATTPGTSRNLFGGGTGTLPGTSNSVFGAPASTIGSTSIFGSTGTSVFGGNTNNSYSTAGNTTNTSVFGSSDNNTQQPVVQQQQQSIFGPSSTTGNSGSVFGSVPPTSGSLFGNTLTSGTTSLFGNATQQPQQPAGNSGSIFGGSQQAPATSISSSGGSLFGGVTSTSNNNQSHSLFGGGGVGQPSSTTSAVPTGSMFGSKSAASISGPVFGSSSTSTQPADPNDHRYSPIEKLSEADKRQYQSDTFTYIPYMPPPRELCY